MSQFTMLFDSFSSVFTAPSFLHFQVLVMSLWALPLITGGRISLARIWLAAGVSQHWDALLRFVRAYRWDKDELARSLTLFVLERVKERLPRSARAMADDSSSLELMRPVTNTLRPRRCLVSRSIIIIVPEWGRASTGGVIAG
jgi:hypothetical protein